MSNMQIDDNSVKVVNPIPRLGGSMKKKRIRDRKGVQGLVLTALHEMKEEVGVDTFQAPLGTIVDRIKRDPKPSPSTVLRAGQDLAAMEKITMVKDEKNPRGPYTWTVPGYMPKQQRVIQAGPRRTVAPKATEAPTTGINASEIARKVDYIMSRRQSLAKEMADLEKQYQRIHAAISGITVPQTAAVRRGRRRMTLRAVGREEAVAAGV